MQIAIAFVSAGFGTFNEYLDVHPYFGAEKKTYHGIFTGQFWSTFGESFGSWFILFLNIVPISMLVTLEGVKFFQAVMIQNDWMIYDVNKDMPTRAQSSNLNEELGTVHFVFSDKTGTLTQNVMEFKKFSAGNLSYGKSNP
jgi:phospholipid-transporting ATPase